MKTYKVSENQPYTRKHSIITIGANETEAKANARDEGLCGTLDIEEIEIEEIEKVEDMNDIPRFMYVCFGTTPDGEIQHEYSFNPDGAKIKLLENYPNAKHVVVVMYQFAGYALGYAP